MTSYLASQPWLLVVLPFAAAGIGLVFGRLSRIVAPAAALFSALLPLLAGASVAWTVAASEPAAQPWRSVTVGQGGFEWFSTGASVIKMGWALDIVSGIMLVVVGAVAVCVVVFSLGYMSHDAGWNRYFALLAAFVGSMSLLVIADGFLTLFFGWELVGACSYLLIGFWYEKKEARAAAVKAFLTTRVGDVGLLVGMAVLWRLTDTLSYERVMTMLPGMPIQWVSVAAICVAVGAIGKSAQFPLHAWLPDAMEGPTPVSALIHAATMVAAGVFLIVRVGPLFDISADAQTFVLWVGVISATGAALAATVQRDIKKVLAYSTISQLGFMFAALGSGAWFAAMFHLVTHAAFKALLFLGSGSVIHGSGTQDLYAMGGLRRKMPVTFTTWCIGSLALAGFPGLSGFFSKDLVLESVWHHSSFAGSVLMVVAAITAFYVARASRLAFYGEHVCEAHESGLSMLLPLGALSLPALALGWGETSMAAAMGVEPEPMAIAISVSATVAFLVGGVAGWSVARSPRSDVAFQRRLGAPAQWLASAYRWDHAVDLVVVRPVTGASRAIWAFGDRLLADGAVRALAAGSMWLSAKLSGLQAGDGQAYALAGLVGVVLILAITAMMGG